MTLIARNREDLERAKLDLIKRSSSTGTQNQHVLAYSVDVAGGSGGEGGSSSSESVILSLERIIAEAEHRSGPISLLACCAGTAVAATFEDTSPATFHRLMAVNYFGTVNTVKAAMSSLKKSAKSSKSNSDGAQVLIFSSLAGLFGLYGYAAYAASKFALVGFAEVRFLFITKQT